MKTHVEMMGASKEPVEISDYAPAHTRHFVGF